MRTKPWKMHHDFCAAPAYSANLQCDYIYFEPKENARNRIILLVDTDKKTSLPRSLQNQKWRCPQRGFQGVLTVVLLSKVVQSSFSLK